jgi:GntR family transcriptional repressor for pyruvate dehydrogenase complex
MSVIPNPLKINILATVVESQDASIADLLEVRMGLECNAAAMAATRANGKDIWFMGKSIEEMQAEALTGRLATEADTSFHMAIAWATNNPLHVFMMKNLYDFLFTGIRVNLEGLYQVPGNIDITVDQHKAIYEWVVTIGPQKNRYLCRPQE